MIKIGLAGTGTGASFVAQAVEIAKKEESMELVAVFSRNLDKAKDFGEKYNIRSYYNDYEQMIKKSGIDVVVICTPHFLHYTMAKIALENDIHVLVDKPMAISLKEADDMIKLAESKKLKLGVILQTRFNEDAQLLRKLIGEGKFGKILFGSVNLFWYRSQDYYSKSSWRGRWETEGGGVLINQSIHTIDLLLWLVGDVESVHGFIDTRTHNIEVEDIAVASLKFKSGAFGVIQATTSADPGYPTILDIVGTKGRATIEGSSLKFLMYDGNIIKKSSHVDTGSWSSPACVKPIDHYKLILDFVRSVVSDSRPYVDGYEGRRSLELILAIYSSSRRGNVVKLPLLY
jgi:predicted dehydrogenase